MPSRMVKFKKNLQLLSFDEQISALRSKIIKDNKGIMTFLYTLFVFIYCFVTIMIYNPLFFFFIFSIKLFFITNIFYIN